MYLISALSLGPGWGFGREREQRTTVHTHICRRSTQGAVRRAWARRHASSCHAPSLPNQARARRAPAGSSDANPSGVPLQSFLASSALYFSCVAHVCASAGRCLASSAARCSCLRPSMCSASLRAYSGNARSCSSRSFHSRSRSAAWPRSFARKGFTCGSRCSVGWMTRVWAAVGAEVEAMDRPRWP